MAIFQCHLFLNLPQAIRDCPGRPIRGFEPEQRARFSAKKIAYSPVVATNYMGRPGTRDD
jgi:hypothetical protein